MRAVQAFEIRLNFYLSLQMIWGGILRKSRLLKHDEIEKLLKGGKTLQEALRGLHQEFSKRNLSIFSDDAAEVLRQLLAGYRNFLAHNYFPSRSLLIRDANMHPALIAELTHYADTFELAESLFARMTDFTVTKLFEALGAKKSVEQKRSEEQKLAQRTEQLEELKRVLERMGIEMPTIPSSDPKIS